MKFLHFGKDLDHIPDTKKKKKKKLETQTGGLHSMSAF